MTPAEIEALVEKVATRTIDNFLLRLGIDPSDDEAVAGFKKNLQHLDRWRRANDKIGDAAVRAAIGVIICGALAAFWLGIWSIGSKLFGK